MGKKKPNPKFNRFLPLHTRYFEGRNDKIFQTFKKGLAFSAIAKRYKMSKTRAQQIVSRRLELEKLPRAEQALLTLSPQAIKVMQGLTGKRGVAKKDLKGWTRKSLMQKPGVGAHLAGEICAWARLKDQ